LDVTISEDGTVDGIPDDVDGIPVNVDRSPRAVETACYYDDYDDIPGGAAYQCPEVNGTATLCCRVKDYRDGAWRTYMLGVRHNHMSDGDNCQDEDASQTSWEQFDTPAGEVEEGFQHHDAVLLELTDSSRSVSTAIADESGTVSGRVTSDGLDCLKSTNETVYKRGHANCKGSGTIEKTEEILECGWSTDYVGGVVRTTCEQNSGDSGGPVYYKDGSDLYIVNIATHRPGDGSHDAMGSSAESMNDKQGFWFGGDPYDGNCS
jgi:hypothetical protein